ncbi:MAG: acetyl-CoA carboxylase biotin carboxyl carrier protein [Cellulosilyticaceae bacterium]
MNIDLIKELIGEFKDSDLTKLKLNVEGFELELGRKKEIAYASSPVQMTAPLVANMQSATTEVNINTESSNQIRGHEVTAPLVGTFYPSSSPGQEPFVKIGSKVKKGDIVCIIEAMKLMNEVEADADGVITDILVESESMVEYNQPLFVIQ